jgi:hypothetical protein
MKKYTKDQILLAGKIGEVSMIDVRHVVSLLDEAVILEKQRKERDKECKCIRYSIGSKWYPNGCKIHPDG